MPVIPVVVTWKGSSFNIKLDTAEPVEAFRLQLQALTDVPCSGQKIMGFPGGVLKASSWAEIPLKGDKISVIMSGERAAACASGTANPDPPASDCAAAAVSQLYLLPSSQRVESDPSVSAATTTTLLKVTIKTAQGALMLLPEIAPDCLIGRIKMLLSQPPHSCGQPVDMKLIYKGGIHLPAVFCCLGDEDSHGSIHLEKRAPAF
jgi:hypothetical protein